MALRGTLRDFGIADILQLIGQQTKTGALVLKDRGREVRILFDRGNVVHAESSTRQERDLLGRILVRGEVISEQQLTEAVALQKRTLKRLGDIFVDMGVLDWDQVKRFHQYQTTEVIYRLFLWKSGTYEFEPGDVQYDKEIATPISAENLLMEGFRQVDEWPIIRKRIATYDIVFARDRPLPGGGADVDEAPAQHASADGGEPSQLDMDLDKVFGEMEKSSGDDGGEFKSIGETERQIYQLIDGARDVRKIIDLSLAGEFEVCKALLNLLNAGYIRVVSGGRRRVGWGRDSIEGRFPLVPILIRGGLYLVIVGIAAALFQLTGGVEEWRAVGQQDGTRFRITALQEQLAQNQMRKIGAALDVYRLEQGSYPESLPALAESRLLSKRDLRYPWTSEYYYRRATDSSYVLMRPVH